MKFEYNDGGRAEAGYKVHARGDCVVRAVAIATGLPYQEVYDKVNKLASMNERGKKKSSSRKGVYTKKDWFKEYMKSLGFIWTSTMSIGSGCKVHLRDNEIPMKGTLLVSVSKHYTVVKDGVINDIYDPSRDGDRCVYGYWAKFEGPSANNPTQNFILVNENRGEDIEEI